MSQRRWAPRATVSTLYATVARGLRASIVASGLLAASAKIVPVLLAERIAAGDERGAAVVGAVGVCIMAGSRILSSGIRVSVECGLQRAVVRAALAGDVLVETTPRPVGALFEPMYHARVLLTDTLPDLAASVVAFVLVAPLLAVTLPARAIAVSAIALTAVVAVLLWLSRASTKMQERVWLEHDRVYERASFAIEGRLELVARGAEDDATRALDGAIAEYRSVARRGAWGAAMLGRAPLAAGLAAIVVVIVVDASSRQVVTSAVLAKALVLAACLPIIHGLVLRTSEFLRASVQVAPVVALLSAPRRPELGRGGAEPPATPVSISARELTFSYDVSSVPTLRGVSFDWRAGTVLLIEGRNGAGKSTLMRLLLGLREAQSGTMTVGGVDLRTLDLPAFRRGVAYLPQRPYLGAPDSTVRSALRTVAGEVPDSALRSALARVALAQVRSGEGVDALDVPIGELSAGQRQRLALARVLLQDAAIYLLDEPDANLDRAGIALVGEIIRELVARGRMVAVAAHTEELTALPGTHLTLR